MNFSEAMFYENYLTSDFHTNTVISACLPICQNGVENRDKAYSNMMEATLENGDTDGRMADGA